MNPAIIVVEQNGPAIIVVSATGPQGPEGPPGPASGGGAEVVVTESSTIPMNQIYTVVNGSAATTQTLPPISEAFDDGIANPYTVINYNNEDVTIQAAGEDLIMGQSSALMRGVSSFTLLPTPLGWLLI